MSNISPYIRLVCEGDKTEPNYFNPYFRDQGIKGAKAFQPKDHSPRGIAKAAKEELRTAQKLKIPKDKIFIWAIFDRDGHQGIAGAIDMLQGTPIGIAFSNICFEFWILLHYENTARAFATCDEVISHIHRNHDAAYGKSNDHFVRLKNRMQIAISNAQRLAQDQRRHDDRPGSITEGANDPDNLDSPNWNLNPYTDVHLIFESLLEKGFIDGF